jgi:HPt (histidine-containing phosphotransfer) domain-containing protein
LIHQSGAGEALEHRPTETALPESEIIEQLQRLLGPDRVKEMLSQFRGQLSKQFQGQLTDPDALTVLRQEAHTMIGQAGMLGFGELAQCCRKLLDACKSDVNVSAALAELGSAQARALAALCSINGGKRMPGRVSRSARNRYLSRP